MRKIILFLALALVIISCGEKEDYSLIKTNFKTDSAIGNSLIEGSVEIKIYHTDKFICDEISTLCKDDSYKSVVPGLTETRTFINKEHAYKITQTGYYVVTALGKDKNGDVITKLGCSCPYKQNYKNTRPTTREFNTVSGISYDVYLELREK